MFGMAFKYRATICTLKNVVVVVIRRSSCTGRWVRLYSNV